MLSDVRAAFLGVLSCCHAKELFSQPHLLSVRSFVPCSSPSLKRSLLCSSFISGVKLLLKGCTGEIETLSRVRAIIYLLLASGCEEQG